MTRPSPAVAICFVASLVLALAWDLSPPRERLDQINLDGQFRLLRSLGPAPVENDPVLIGMDDATHRAFREPFVLWHAQFGALFRALSLAGPSVVGLDVVLPDRTYAFLGSHFDGALLKGLYDLKQVAPIVVAKTIDGSRELRPLFSPIVSIVGDDGLGMVVLSTDSDLVLRRYRAAVRADDGPPIGTLAAVMAARLGLDPGDGVVRFHAGELVPYVPMHEVIAWSESGDTARLEATFGGRPVLIGRTVPFEDVQPYPVALSAWQPAVRDRQPGVLLHLQALRSYMTGGLLQETPRWVGVVLALAAAALAWIGGTSTGVAAALAASLALWLGSTYALHAGHVLAPMGAIGGAVLAAVIRTLLGAVLAFRERRRLRQSFGSYVSPTVLAGIMDGTISTSAEGERREVCVLFSDVRDFTTLSETRSPEAIIALLNDYFTEMTAAVHAHGGTVDKFIGDGLMCFFGAPANLGNPSRDAFNAAREMIDRLEVLNRRFERESRIPLRIGIGLHCGEAVIGHVGSKTRNEYTAIGDTVNTASRLEGLTKSLGRPIAASQAVVDAIGPTAGFEDLGTQALKGRADMTVYGWSASSDGPPSNERRTA